jgi:hypothetical protein
MHHGSIDILLALHLYLIVTEPCSSCYTKYLEMVSVLPHPLNETQVPTLFIHF